MAKTLATKTSKVAKATTVITSKGKAAKATAATAKPKTVKDLKTLFAKNKNLTLNASGEPKYMASTLISEPGEYIVNVKRVRYLAGVAKPHHDVEFYAMNAFNFGRFADLCKVGKASDKDIKLMSASVYNAGPDDLPGDGEEVRIKVVRKPKADDPSTMILVVRKFIRKKVTRGTSARDTLASLMGGTRKPSRATVATEGAVVAAAPKTKPRKAATKSTDKKASKLATKTEKAPAFSVAPSAD